MFSETKIAIKRTLSYILGMGWPFPDKICQLHCL